MKRASAARLGCVLLALMAAALSPRDAAGQTEDSGRFRHDLHGQYECSECHSNGLATTTADRSWCADCHHVNVAYEQCQRCHTVGEIAPEPLRRTVTFHFPGAERVRALTFDHRIHRDVSCANCHTGGAALRVEANCSGCHEDHHQVGRDCTACHQKPTAEAHTSEVHRDLTGCAASGCHTGRPIDYSALQDERPFCLACHVDQREHEAPNLCVECHKLGQTERSPGP